MSHIPTISVVVPTYQRCTSLRRLLQALCRQTPDHGNFEVIVSVDGSTDGTREMLQHFGAPYPLRYIWGPNAGRATACNAGIKLARAPLIVLLDDDMEPLPGFLAAHRQMHAQYPMTGVLGAVPVRTATRQRSCVVHYVRQKFARQLEELAHSDRAISISSFYTGNFSLPRDIFQQIGAFDETFTIYGNEDLELFWRLKEAGVTIQYSSQALAFQEYDKDVTQWARDNIAEGRTSVLLALRHPETFGHVILAIYNEGLYARRAIRSWLLARARQSSQTTGRLITLVRALDRLPILRVDKVFYAIEDLFYWLGVQSALYDLPQGAQLQAFLQMWQLHYGTSHPPFFKRHAVARATSASHGVET